MDVGEVARRRGLVAWVVGGRRVVDNGFGIVWGLGGKRLRVVSSVLVFCARL